MAEYKSKHTGAVIDVGIDKANAALPKSGGTMTGALTLAADPTQDMHAATKKYVDNSTPKNVVKTVNGVAPDANGNVQVEGGGGSYTLPTASATVKGGVMVGEGLQMDGDVMSIDGDEYVLLETITLAEEGLLEIIRTAEPDGTPYNLKAMMVTTLTSEGSAGYATAYVSPFIQNGWEHVGSVGVTYRNSSSRYCSKTIFRQLGNIWDTFGYAGYIGSSSSTVGRVTANDVFFVKEGKTDRITKLRFYTFSDPFPVGLEIKIYGVRA